MTQTMQNQPASSMGSFGYRTDPANSMTPQKPTGGSYPPSPMFQPSPMKAPKVPKGLTNENKSTKV